MPGIDVIRSDEGFITDLYFSQSWLTSLLTCPEQARLDMVGELPRRDTDATATGTAFHRYAEDRLKGEDEQEAHDRAEQWLIDRTSEPGFEWVQVQTGKTLLNHLDNCITAWEREMFPQLSPRHVEKSFSAAIGQYDPGTARNPYIIQLHIKGTPDCIDHDLETIDWKTAGQERTEWEDDRWSIQAAAYTYLLDQSLSKKKRLASYSFRYFVMLKTNGGHQSFAIQRDQRHWDWLRAQCVSAAKMIIENPTGPWLLNDQSWKCSPKWCGAWDQCRGKVMGPNPW